MGNKLPENLPIKAPTALRIAIAGSGLTQRYIAEQAGISEAHLSRIVNGLHVSDDMRRAIAGVLGRQVEDLFPSEDVAA